MDDTKKERVSWLDIARGIVMLFVIMSHLKSCPIIYKTFFGPVFLSGFFFISGYLFNSKKNFKEYFINKTKTLLVPFVILGIINILLRMVISFNEQEPILVQLKNFVLQIGETSGLWFIACLYVASIVFYFVNKLLKSNRKVYYYVVIALCGIVSFLYNKYIQIDLPWHIQKLGIAIFFMGIGLIYKQILEEKLKQIENNKTLIIISVIYGLLLVLNYLIYNNLYISVNSYQTGIIIYFMLSLLSIWILVIISKKISANKAIEFVGKNTLVYFAFSGKVQSVLDTFLAKFIIYDLYNVYYISILSTVIIAIVLVVPSVIINKYFPFILGRKYKRKKDIQMVGEKNK